MCSSRCGRQPLTPFSATSSNHSVPPRRRKILSSKTRRFRARRDPGRCRSAATDSLESDFERDQVHAATGPCRRHVTRGRAVGADSRQRHRHRVRPRRRGASVRTIPAGRQQLDASVWRTRTWTRHRALSGGVARWHRDGIQRRASMPGRDSMSSCRSPRSPQRLAGERTRQ